MKFSIQIASVPDGDALVAELWWRESMVAEIYHTDEGRMEIEIYPAATGKAWNFDLTSWLDAIMAAREKLNEMG